MLRVSLLTSASAIPRELRGTENRGPDQIWEQTHRGAQSERTVHALRPREIRQSWLEICELAAVPAGANLSDTKFSQLVSASAKILKLASETVVEVVGLLRPVQGVDSFRIHFP
jgi:hypothetical protein